jgi:2-phospho-L-lactate transferase/gluconeogenesis factor (CofD/UPF0052 family)
VNGPRAVALGGGHGLYATLSAPRLLTDHITAVATVADDGGSSGRLRGELGILPPGDLRMALAALASGSPSGARWSELWVVVLNLAPQPGETAGFSPEQHPDVLSQHAPELRIDAVLADQRSVPVPDLLARSATALGARTVLTPVGQPDGSPRHNPAALADAVRSVQAEPGRRGGPRRRQADSGTRGSSSREENTRWR